MTPPPCGCGVGGASVVGLRSGLIEPTLGDVAHPLDDIMVAVVQLGLKHLQVADLQSRAGKRNL